MKTILKKLTAYIAGIVKGIFPAHEKEEATMKTVHSRATELYKNTLTLVKGEAGTEANRPLYEKELMMLRRRLVQYQRTEHSGNAVKKEEAANRLLKEWRKVLRRRLRVMRREEKKGVVRIQ